VVRTNVRCGRTSVSKASSDALAQLAGTYRDGVIVQPDPVKAYVYMNAYAMASGDQVAKDWRPTCGRPCDARISTRQCPSRRRFSTCPPLASAKRRRVVDLSGLRWRRAAVAPPTVPHVGWRTCATGLAKKMAAASALRAVKRGGSAHDEREASVG
jgi:hypothetical protein